MNAHSSGNPDLVSDQNPYGVEEDVLPYPDGCVFLVVGADVTREPDSMTIERMGNAVVVAQRPDVAREGFLLQAKSNHKENWEVFSVYSLSEIIEAMSPPMESIIAIPETTITRMFGRSMVWIIEEPIKGVVQRSYVSAHSAKSVYEYLMKAGHPNATFTSIDEMKASLKNMEAVRDGDMRKAFYAYDFQGDELKQRDAKMWREASPEKRAWLNDWQHRHGRPDFNQAIGA